MAIHKSRVQKSDQGSSFDSRVEWLLRALNDDWKGSIKGDRTAVDPRALLLLVKRFQALERITSYKRIPLFWRSSSGDIEHNPELTRIYRAVNIALRRYAARPVIMPDYMADMNPQSRGWSFEWARSGKSSQPFMEVGFALTVVDLASSGRISALKQCEECRKWLFARFPHQRFCSEACKDHFHKFNDADKKRRREWAKKNYWLHKQKNVK
jgi:hypothetical protein